MAQGCAGRGIGAVAEFRRMRSERAQRASWAALTIIVGARGGGEALRSGAQARLDAEIVPIVEVHRRDLPSSLSETGSGGR